MCSQCEDATCQKACTKGALYVKDSIVHVDEELSQVSTRLTFLTKNPFRSTYFAVLSMAAELSTIVDIAAPRQYFSIVVLLD